MAAKKSKLFRTQKEIKKTLQQNILESVTAAAVGVGSKIGYDALKSKIPDNVKKFGGLGLMIVGTAGNVYAKDAYVKAASLGICATSGSIIVDELASPELKAKIGFAGLGATQTQNSNTITDEEFIRLEREFEQLANNEPVGQQADDFDESYRNLENK